MTKPVKINTQLEVEPTSTQLINDPYKSTTYVDQYGKEIESQIGWSSKDGVITGFHQELIINTTK